jgi:hypothetical protein
MADRTTFTSPSVAYVVVHGAETKVVRFSLYAEGFGPAYTAPVPITTVVTPTGDATASHAPATYTPSWGAYNGLLGENPESANSYVDVTVGCGAGSSGTVVVSGGPLNGTIYVSSSVEDDLILDNFDASNGTHLHDHAPDTCPGGSAWAGTLANYSITGNVLTLGCCSGNADEAYINAGIDDSYIVYADITRTSGYAGTPKPGVVGRASSNGVDFVRFIVDNDGATTCNLVWAHMAGVTNHGSGTIATGYAWVRDTAKRMLLHFVGASVHFYIGAVDGSSYTFLTTKTLSPTFIGNGHTYVGLWGTAVGGSTVFTKFATIQLAALVAHDHLTFAALVNGVPTAAQAIDITQVPAGFPLGNLTAVASYTDGDGWITPTLAATAAPTSVSIVCDPGALTAGVYHGAVTVDSAENDGDPQVITVELTLSLAGAVASSAAPGVSAGVGTTFMPGPAGVMGCADLVDGSDGVVVALQALTATTAILTAREPHASVVYTYGAVPWPAGVAQRLGFECRGCRRILPFWEPAGGGVRTFFGFATVTALPTATSFTYTLIDAPSAADLPHVRFVTVTDLDGTTATLPFSGVVTVGQTVQLALEPSQHHAGEFGGGWTEWDGVLPAAVLSVTPKYLDLAGGRVAWWADLTVTGGHSTTWANGGGLSTLSLER